MEKGKGSSRGKYRRDWSQKLKPQKSEVPILQTGWFGFSCVDLS
jgi:hypothetical protein